VAVFSFAFLATGTFAAEISTPAIPTAGFGELLTDPEMYAAIYGCSVTNLTNKAQSVRIDFVNHRASIVPEAADPLGASCNPMTGTEVTIGPEETYAASCAITVYVLPPGDFRQEAVRCRVDELTGNAANWKISLCATPTPTKGGATVCVEGY